MTAALTDDREGRLRAAALGASQELGRRNFLDFCKLTYRNFEAPKHIAFIAQILSDVEQGIVPRVAISAPPGHGKSSLLQCFIAWFCARGERRRVLAISANESLAKRNSRDAQVLVRNRDRWPWPDISLTTDSVLEWALSNRSEVRIIGREGRCVGFRAELALIDDLQGDAGTDESRKNDEEWMRGELTSRLEPSGRAVIIQTRWHDDDIIGRLQAGESADQWMFVNMPAIAGDDDILGRASGVELWPSRWPLEKLNAIKAEVGSSIFGALYMGDPQPAESAVFDPSWFERRYDDLPNREGLFTIQAIDSAWREGPQADRSCIVTLVSDKKDVYITDCWFGRLLYPDLRRKVVDEFKKHRPSRVYVEEAASGYAIVADLRRSTGIPIIGVKPGRDSKEARASSIAGLWESGRVKLPRSAPFLHELISEHVRFGRGKHDDIVDATVLGIRQAQRWQRYSTGGLPWAIGRNTPVPMSRIY